MRPIFGCFCALLLLAIPADGRVFINEIMFHPGHDPEEPEDLRLEYIELINIGTAPVALAGYSFDRGIAYTFSKGEISPGGYLVVAADPDSFQDHYSQAEGPVLGPWTGRLSNASEKIRLIDPRGQTIDAVTYFDEGAWSVRRKGPEDQGHRGWEWSSPADGSGSSLELINPAMGNGKGQNWGSSQSRLGTPGFKNSLAATETAPIITKTRHHPPLPGPDDPVLITATIDDEFPERIQARVRYRNSHQGGSFESRAMNDAGLEGDEEANDGTFSTFLPPQPEGHVVEFYLEADDGQRSRTYPAPSDDEGGQEANCLYQIESAPIHSDQPVYRAILTKSEASDLNGISRSGSERKTNAHFNATFIATYGDETDIRYEVGLRLRGNSSRTKLVRSYRLRFPDDHDWGGDSKHNIQGHFPHLQVLGSQLFRSSGLPAGEALQVSFLINGVNDADTDKDRELHHGAYAHVIPNHKGLINDAFPDDSNGSIYYKKSDEGQSWVFHNGRTDRYAEDSGWIKQNHLAARDWSDLEQFLEVMNDQRDPNWFQSVRSVFNLDHALRWFAVMSLISNGETNLSNGKDEDYSVYIPVEDPR
ncbi:MAG: lamin tail domain-containing protein, partial [Verrucomicrobiota bacterium]